MDDPSRGTKQERIAQVDSEVLSPQDRAARVWEILQKAAPSLTNWDVVCFAANYLGWQAASLQWLTLPAKHICRLVYTAHYLATGETDVSSGFAEHNPQSNGTGADNRSPTPDLKPESITKSPRDSGGPDVSGGGFG